MAHGCRVEGCSEEIPGCISSERLCLRHFSELVLRRTDEVRADFLGGNPVDSVSIEWLLGDAAHMVHTLAGTSAAKSESLLEVLLCLANLQDYIAHHSIPVKNASR